MSRRPKSDPRLRRIRNKLNHRWFRGAVDVAIVWDDRPPIDGNGFLLFGEWDSENATIRIWRWVGFAPYFVLECTIFHELVHAALWPVTSRIQHGDVFRAVEALHPDIERCRDWERDHATDFVRVWAWAHGDD